MIESSSQRSLAHDTGNGLNDGDQVATCVRASTRASRVMVEPPVSGCGEDRVVPVDPVACGEA